jgi:hypothetical protein
MVRVRAEEVLQDTQKAAEAALIEIKQPLSDEQERSPLTICKTLARVVRAETSVR